MYFADLLLRFALVRPFPFPLRRVGSLLSSSTGSALSGTAGVVLTLLLDPCGGQTLLCSSLSLAPFDVAILLLGESGK